jgi:hypothetical protein
MLFLLGAQPAPGASNAGFLAFAFVAGLNADGFVARLEKIAASLWGAAGARDAPAPAQARFTLAVCAIARNEAPYLLEWIAYYKTLGFAGVFIYDNVSDDGGSELLRELDRAGEITRIFWPRIGDIPPQRHAYQDFLTRFASRYDYVLICDIDEFLVVAGDDVDAFIREGRRIEPDVAAFAIPWIVFGSGGQETQTDGLVVERFTQCEASPSPAVKSLFDPRRAVSMRTHYCDLLTGVYLDNAYRPARWDEKMSINLVDPSPGRALIHHYYTKSREEWVKRRQNPKADRGHVEHKKDKFYWRYAALPATRRFPPERIAAIRTEIARLKTALSRGKTRAFAELLHIDRSYILGWVRGGPAEDAVVYVRIGDAYELMTICQKSNSGQRYFVAPVKWTNADISVIEANVVGSRAQPYSTRRRRISRRDALANLVVNFPSYEEAIFSTFLSLGKEEADFVFALATLVETDFPHFPQYGRFVDELRRRRAGAPRDPVEPALVDMARQKGADYLLQLCEAAAPAA